MTQITKWVSAFDGAFLPLVSNDEYYAVGTNIFRQIKGFFGVQRQHVAEIRFDHETGTYTIMIGHGVEPNVVLDLVTFADKYEEYNPQATMIVATMKDPTKPLDENQ